nr:ORF5 protein [Fusarium graminearum sclerotimonavirus 1]
MPSYKEKYSYLQYKLDIMEKKILITETEMQMVKDKIKELESENEKLSSQDNSDGYMRSQLCLIAREVESQVLSKSTFPMDTSSLTDAELIMRTTALLQDLSKVFRESRTRAETMIQDICSPSTGKLLKRERKEHMKNESMTSLAAALATSPERHMSPPPRFRDRSDSANSRGASSRSQSRSQM